MRILKVSEAYHPFLEKGGPPVKVRALARGLARRGHRVTVLSADFGGRADDRAAAFSPGPHGRVLEEDGVEAIYLPSRLHYREVTWNPALGRFCRDRLANFDVAHIYGLYDLLGPGLAARCRSRGVPYVVEPIGMFRPIVRNIWLKRMYHLVWGHRLLAGAARIVATAEQEAEELAAGGVPREKIVLRRNGVEQPAEFPPHGAFCARWNLHPETKRVLFLGRLVSKKSPELLVEAFSQLVLQDRAGNACLIFAGPDGGDGTLAKLKALASSKGLAGRVLFVGPLYGDEKWAAYGDATVFVLPSQNENFGNAAAESIVAGTPVIVTDTCGVAPLLAGRAGLMVPHSAEAIAGALAQLLGDEALRARLAAGCPDLLPQLGWEEPIVRMESLYAECVRSKASPSAPSAMAGRSV